jgi:hypothetical protein
MKTTKIIILLCPMLLLAAIAQGQDKVMRVHSGGNVVYAANTSQVDSITFQDGALPESLINTMWKLNGIVDTETGVVTELEPKECRDCYTLTFGTDYTAIAHGIEYYSVLLDLTNLRNYKIPNEWTFYPEEYYDGKAYDGGVEFCEAVLATKSCTVANDEVRLYYGDKKSYLRFIPFIKNAADELNELITSNLSKKGVATPALLIGDWDFITYAYTEDGITISDVPSKPKGLLLIKGTKANSFKIQWEFKYENTFYYECYLSGCLVELPSRGSTLIHVPDERENEVDLATAIRNAYSFVIIGDELIIYYTGKEDKNLLVLKKR